MQHGRFHRLIRAGAALAAATTMLAQPNRPEEDFRAALILGFARFSEWPGARESALPRDNPIVIGVVQHPGLAAALERAAKGKLINGRPVVVRPVPAAGQTAGCHIVYFSRMPALRLAEAFREAPAQALTVGEDEHFLAAGGAVRLIEKGGRVSFEANLTAVQAAGVRISSKLLRLGNTQRTPARKKATP